MCQSSPCLGSLRFNFRCILRCVESSTHARGQVLRPVVSEMCKKCSARLAIGQDHRPSPNRKDGYKSHSIEVRLGIDLTPVNVVPWGDVMASLWFVTGPLPGRWDWGGMLKAARLLGAGGHEVRWVWQPPIAPMVEAAGIEFAPIAETGWLWPPPPMPDPRTLKPAEGIFLRYRPALDTWLSEALSP